MRLSRHDFDFPISGTGCTVRVMKGSDYIIDEQALQARYSGRDSLINKLIATFLRTHGDSPQRIREAIAARDFESLSEMAHSIKGLSGYLEAKQLFILSEHAQVSAARMDASALELCDDMADALDAVIDVLKDRNN